MKQRSPAAVFLLSLITFGIYALVWEVKTKGELNRLGADIPTAWLLIVPLGNLYWIWKYCQGVEKVSNGQTSAVLALILMLLLSIVGLAILQSEFNKIGEAQPAGPGPSPVPPANPGMPMAPPADTVPPAAPAEPAAVDGATVSPDTPQPETGTQADGQSGPTLPSDTPPNPPASLIQ